MERTKDAHPDTLFFNIDAMDFNNRALLMNDLKINSVPSFRVYVNGELSASVSGINNFDQVEVALNEAIAKHDSIVEDDTFNVIDDTTVSPAEEAAPLTLAQVFARRMGIQQHLAALF